LRGDRIEQILISTKDLQKATTL